MNTRSLKNKFPLILSGNYEDIFQNNNILINILINLLRINFFL